MALEAKEDEYAELIGDASQDYFGVKELRGFVEDLLTKDRSRVLTRWKRDGLRVDLCESTPEMDCKESEEIPSESVDEEVPDETGNADDSGTDDSEVETPTVHEEPETENGDSDSTENEPETYTYQSRPGGGRTRQRGGNRSNTSGRSRGIGYNTGGGRPGEEHENLKDYLADNPSELGVGLELVKKEHTFESGDRVDILLKDGSGNPVTVEVKPYILPRSYGEVWQAVRYKHIAAVEYQLPCEQVRSILAAPEIPDDVKAKCKQLGIEAFEKTQK